MKKLSVISMISLIMIFSCTSEVIIDKEAEIEAIQNVIESFFIAGGTFDSETMKSLVTEDFLAFDMAKIMSVDDMVNAIIALKEMGLTDISYNIVPVKSEVYGNTALFCYKNTGTAKLGDQDIKLDFIESCLFEKTEEGWKIKFLHSTEVLPPTPEPETPIE